MEILASVLEAVPGLTFVFAIAVIVLLPDGSEIAEAIRVFVVAWCLYRISKRMDGLFDLFYGPEPRQGRCYRLRTAWYRLRKRMLGYKSLEVNRNNAMPALSITEVEGLYDKAKQRAEATKNWEKEIYPLIGVSKAARAFIVPFFLIGVGMELQDRPRALAANGIAAVAQLRLLAGFREDFARAGERLEFLREPLIPFGVCLITLILFACLRWKHMNELYALVGKNVAGESEKAQAVITGAAAGAAKP
jgi:hypothetical protein